jgi:Bacterial low temperature requirement A protein (LtrA)
VADGSAKADTLVGPERRHRAVLGNSLLGEDVGHAALRRGAARHSNRSVLASRHDAALRRSVSMLAISSTITVGLLIAASFVDRAWQEALWALAILLDFGAPATFGIAGWRLVPAHFADRHNLVIMATSSRSPRRRDRRVVALTGGPGGT